MRTRRTECAALVPAIFLLLATTGLAESVAGTKKAELGRAVSQPSSNMDSPDVRGSTLRGDTGPRFLVRALRISGNSILSTDELLEGVPSVYREYEIDPGTGRLKRDPASKDLVVRDTYDFTSLKEIVSNPGSGRSVSAKTILGLTKYLLSVYDERGYRGIYVYVPPGAFDAEGKFVGGVLDIHVLEARVARIEVKRYDFARRPQEREYLKDSVLEWWSPIKEGQVLQRKKLDDFTNLLNLDPDRYVTAVVSKADEPNVIDLIYEVYEENPWHVYVQADDSGTRDRQWAPRLGVINTNLMGIDDRLSVQYQASLEKGIEDDYAAFGMYDFPVCTPRLRLSTYGGYSQFDITTEGISFLGNGSLFGAILSYNVTQFKGWFVDLTGSLSRENSQVTPSLGIGSDVDMDLWGVGVRLYRRAERDMSETFLSLNRTESMGGSSREAFEEARPDAGPHFAINTLSLAHAQYLDTNRVHRAKASFRLIHPDARLVPAKMTAFGGLYTVRGYEEDEIVADGGILASGQYEFDLVQYYWPGWEDTIGPDSTRRRRWLKKLAPLAFVDFGRAVTEDPVPGEVKSQTLASVGAGLIVEIRNNFTGALYYGWALRSTEDTERGDGRLDASLSYRF